MYNIMQSQTWYQQMPYGAGLNAGPDAGQEHARDDSGRIEISRRLLLLSSNTRKTQ